MLYIIIFQTRVEDNKIVLLLPYLSVLFIPSIEIPDDKLENEL